MTTQPDVGGDGPVQHPDAVGVRVRGTHQRAVEAQLDRVVVDPTVWQVVAHRAREHDWVVDRDFGRQNQLQVDRAVDVPSGVRLRGQIERAADEAQLHLLWSQIRVLWYGVVDAEGAARRRGDVGEPVAVEPYLDRLVGKWIVDDVQQCSIDYEQLLAVYVTAAGREHDVRWHAHVHPLLVRAVEVVLRIGRVSLTHGVDPHVAALEVDAHEVCSRSDVSQQGVLDAEDARCRVGLHHRQGVRTVDLQMQDTSLGHSALLERLPELIEQGAVDVDELT